MILGVLAVLIGLVLLAKAADEFVEGAARLAYHFNLSAVVVGAVVIGFGTSAPEMLVSGIAASQGEVDIAIGAVTGSNIANLTLVLGVAAILGTIHVGRETLIRESPMSFAAVALFALAVQGGISRAEGLLLTLALFVAIGTAIVGAKKTGGEPPEQSGFVVSREVVRTGIGLVFTVLGAQILVFGAERVAEELNLTGGFVGLTVVAIGTSVPELVTAAAAARKGQTDLIVGNLLGSNIFNSLAVGGLIGFVGPGTVQDTALTGIPMWIMVGVAATILITITTGRKVVKFEGIILVLAWFAMLPFLSI